MNLTEAKSIYEAALLRQDRSAAGEAVSSFCKLHDSLTVENAQDLSAFLALPHRWGPQLFVVDVLENYDQFDGMLLPPMLETAIAMPDPSANGRFVKPCLRAFGPNPVIGWLSAAFSRADILRRIGIANLVYHLRAVPMGIKEFKPRRSAGLPIALEPIDSTELKTEIRRAARRTCNLVELYYYKMALADEPSTFADVPDHADALCQRIAGNTEYEDLLYNQLKWVRPAEGT